MSFALVTVVAPLELARVAEAEARIDALGNPARADIHAALAQRDGTDGTHFCSLHAVRSKDPGKAYLALEFSADGTEAQAMARLARTIGPALESVFSLASDWRAGPLGDYLAAHRVRIGVGLFDTPGLAFAGTPGMTVGRILDECRLAAAAAAALTPLDPKTPALERLGTIRDTLSRDPVLNDMLEVGTPPTPTKPATIGEVVGGMIGSFVLTYLWPLGILVLGGGLLGGVAGAALAIPVALVAAIVLLGIAFVALRGQEARDAVEERRADAATLDAILARENRGAQNHMISVTQRKPGLVRWFTARLAFWVIGELAVRWYPPGFLGAIGSIHFARWVTVPGTRDLLFFSNFDSSWESYLEDFITRAHAGLTGVWSNCVGFPRAENLFQRGATDGERFKRFARQSMMPTRFWFLAYPKLTTTEIRTNAAIRLGLSGAMTEDEAVRWMALFGSAERPVGALVGSEIQSLLFGGLGRDMPHGACVLVDLPEAVTDARAWLAAVRPHVAFGDGRWLRHDAIVTLALAPRGLRRLGLPEEGVQGFPYAFLAGMTDPGRARILGDMGLNAAPHWRWGAATPDAALLVYGRTEADVQRLEGVLDEMAGRVGARRVERVALKPVEPGQREPFGFEDGISQPVIRGTYKGLRAADPIHLVEPGEFILGYPDNRGNVPPGPTLAALADPQNMLPLVERVGDFGHSVVDGARDLGRNGSFLAIRELEQDVDQFHRYCAAEAERLVGRLPEPYDVTPEWIGAKLLGRWQNGSSLARHAYQPRDDDRHGGLERPIAPTQGPAGEGAPAHRVPRPAAASQGKDNDFLFGTEDGEGLRCPFGAHIRRANPRDSLSPGEKEEIDISNRHRILRVGRQYQAPAGAKPGLLFMCFNADLERQFEFVQQTWLRNPSFHGLTSEKDPLLGDGDADGEGGTCGFTIPTRYGPVRLSQIPPMVRTRGGGYFFVPGKRLVEFLARPA